MVTPSSPGAIPLPHRARLARLTRWRDVVGYATAAVCLVFVLALLDGLIAGSTRGAGAWRALPGSTLPVDGPLPMHVAGAEALQASTGSADIALEITAAQRGFWLGTPRWRGVLHIAPAAQPGRYTVALHAGGNGPGLPGAASPPLLEVATFTVTLLPDQAAWRRTDPSWSVRVLNHPPWTLAAAAFSLALAAAGCGFALSRKREQLLAAARMAEIHRVEQKDGMLEIEFGLGERHGLRTGDHVTLLDAQWLPRGQAQVTRARAGLATARVEAAHDVRPCDLVRFSPVAG